MSHRPLPPDCHEPLTADERAWAARLAQIGPHGDPPPALDATILAAAHAAAATRQPRRRASRRRWPTLVGAAASLVIVVGLAWQLQPLMRTRPSLGEGPGAPAPIARTEGTLSADVLAAAEPVDRRSATSPPPPPAAASPAAVTRPTAPPPAAAVPVLDAPAQRAADFGDDAIPPYTDYAGKAAARQSATQATANEATRRSRAGPDRERTAAMAPQPFPAASAPAESTATKPASTSYPPPAPVVAASAREAAAGGTAPKHQSNAAAEHDASALYEEVTGTRIRLADLPVRDDARLDASSWLQRIRDRRDAGDIDHALESLALFRRSHPRNRVPDDLARLGR